jgi:hypothetical protein
VHIVLKFGVINVENLKTIMQDYVYIS